MVVSFFWPRKGNTSAAKMRSDCDEGGPADLSIKVPTGNFANSCYSSGVSGSALFCSRRATERERGDLSIAKLRTRFVILLLYYV